MPPDSHVDALLAQAAQLARAGQARAAIDAYQRALALRPASPNSWYNLARLLRRVRHYDEALAAYQKALDHHADQPEEVHLNRAVILVDHLARPVDAERELHTALKLNPRYVPALLNLGNICEHRGDASGAIGHYSRALFIDPYNALALARLSTIQPLSGPDDPLIQRLRQAVTRQNAHPAERADLGFSLGAALDKVEAYDDAFAAYRAANAASRESAAPGSGYDRAAHERLVDRLISMFPTSAPRTGTQGGPASGAGLIFVCGMFRSGSTLVEQMLASHSKVTAGGELDLVQVLVQQHLPDLGERDLPITPAVIERMRERYLATASRLHPNAIYLTDKRPDNFLYIGLIKAMFPDAHIVHTRRHPIDNGLAVFFLHLSHSMPYALDLADIGHWYGQYSRLMQHWKTLYGDDIHDVDYDALVTDPAPVLRRLLGSLGLKWEDACLNFHQQPTVVKTASVWQVRQPLYTRSSGRWHHYEKYVGPLVDELRHQLGDAAL
ncbi:sulfotransferase [Ideonella sp. DXS29W]|uniref:Sulfotransferase n=1 Tax=Ideonella lacteola TaxID=2984193 RepID=A0ABU9BSC0_9BURK